MKNLKCLFSKFSKFCSKNYMSLMVFVGMGFISLTENAYAGGLSGLNTLASDVSSWQKPLYTLAVAVAGIGGIIDVIKWKHDQDHQKLIKGLGAIAVVAGVIGIIGWLTTFGQTFNS